MQSIDIVHPVIQLHAYFAHPENILLVLIENDDPHTRELGLQHIMEARGKGKTPRRKKGDHDQAV